MNLKNTLCSAVLSLGCIGAAFAAPITSTGVGTGGNASVTLNAITFSSFANVAGQFTIGSATGDFAPYMGQNGSIMNLTRAGDPVDTPLNVTDFIVIPVGGQFHFTLTNIAAGYHTDPTPCASLSATATPGQTCSTDTGSPFTLQNVALPSGGVGTLIGMSLSGFAYNGSASTGTTPFFMTLSTQDNRSIQTLESLLVSGAVNDTYSGTITFGPNPPPVPEPASLVLLGSGLIAISFWRRKQQASR